MSPLGKKGDIVAELEDLGFVEFLVLLARDLVLEVVDAVVPDRHSVSEGEIIVAFHCGGTLEGEIVVAFACELHRAVDGIPVDIEVLADPGCLVESSDGFLGGMAGGAVEIVGVVGRGGPRGRSVTICPGCGDGDGLGVDRVEELLAV